MTSTTGPMITPAADSPRRSTEVKPIWFGSKERPLFGMFHVPESRIRSGRSCRLPSIRPRLPERQLHIAVPR